MNGAPPNAVQAPAQGQGQRAGNSLQNLIRPEQVSRLPHLNAQQKAQTEARVKSFWDYINSRANDPNNLSDPRYGNSIQELNRLSASLMAGMKQYNMQRQAQKTQPTSSQPPPNNTTQPVQPPVPAAQPTAAPANGQVPLTALLPEIQARVNKQIFYFPPAMQETSAPAQEWLTQAKGRYGQALQRSQLATQKKIELQKAANNRELAGNPLTPQEQQGLAGKMAQCDRAITESSNFMVKFREQQEGFKAARQQGFQGSAPRMDGSGESATQSNQAQPTVQGPQPHSIASAQQAARNAAATVSAPTPSQPVNGQQLTPIDQAQQVPFNSNAMMAQPQSRPSTAAGPMAQQMNGIQASHAHPTSAVNAGPLNANMSAKTHPPPIPKTLQVPEPTPINMPPSRPTLNGGANVGTPGQLGLPALTAFPGYVLEQSEDGHLLSKKKLAELVREVMGPNSEDQLSAEAEEICLSLVDDFIDDLLVSSCRLAKLRGATSLEAKDVQVILERQYNIRVPGFSTDEVRTVRKAQPAPGWQHKLGAVQAAKLMNGTGGNNTNTATNANAGA